MDVGRAGGVGEEAGYDHGGAAGGTVHGVLHDVRGRPPAYGHRLARLLRCGLWRYIVSRGARARRSSPRVYGVRRRPPEYSRQMGWVLTAFQNAVHELLHAPTLEEGVVATVQCGGDTDTNAAICGALLGAVYGREAIPRGWEETIAGCRPTPETTQPRPEEYWPHDALRLAERIVQAGATRWE